jgi:hypothetical protein
MLEQKNPVASRVAGRDAPQAETAIFLLQKFLHLV